jgi:hypothetical protein
MSSSVVKNDAKRVPPSREHLAHAMTHGNPIMTADAPHRAMMDGKHDGVALAERNDGKAAWRSVKSLTHYYRPDGVPR